MGELAVRWTRILPALGGAAGIVTLAAVSAVPAAATDNPQGPTGSAFAASADVTALNAVKVNLPPLPAAHYPKGGDESVVKATVLPPNGDIASAKVLNAASELQGGKLNSQASIADVRALHGLIEAQLIEAGCTGDPSGVRGDARLVHVKVNGKEQTVDAQHPVDVDALGNAVPGGIIKLRANEQIKDGNGLTVNALHVTVGGAVAGLAKADVVLSQAKCSFPKGAVVPPTSTKPGGPTTSTSKPGGGSSPTSSHAGGGAPTSGGPGVGNAANKGNLANTGTNGVVPMVIGGVALLAAGGGALYWTRRRRAVTPSSGDSDS
jgi:LPXTG-motif cell wall-anchored protein